MSNQGARVNTGFNISLEITSHLSIFRKVLDFGYLGHLEVLLF